ncbi:MAG: hypothetical protein KME13_22260 [Myxacorys californica WJT36-NPBG1]|nr:hypothetical protein [Myxacorys californica WJT36-NPBG1]
MNRPPLLNSSDEVLEALREGKLEFTKARASARVKDEGQRYKLPQQTISKDLSCPE